MFGMIKNSLFGNTEKTEYKLLSSETKVRDIWTQLTVGPHSQLEGLFCASRRVFVQITHSFANVPLTLKDRV